MALRIDDSLTAAGLRPKLERLFEVSAPKILSIERTWKPGDGTPVFTVRGRYTSRGWTEWTQGFQFGSALLQYEATGEGRFLELGRGGTRARMASHVSHVGVHDHGFNNVSTYGNLLRLMGEGRLPADQRERDFYELALKVSGAVQASRWTRLADGTGFMHSFNGPHSLFVDTIRTCRVLVLAHELGHVLMGEQDARISLAERWQEHARNTARYNVYYGEGRDAYDVRGRTAHEAVFNTASGVFRCPNSQQGYSPFSTWTRGLAWAMCGFAELLEYLGARGGEDRGLEGVLVKAAVATAEFYLAHCCADGIPMWDTGAPGLPRLGLDYLERVSDPFNGWEPVDSSAAAIAAQGLWRLGSAGAGAGVGDRGGGRGVEGSRSGLGASGSRFVEPRAARRYRQAALTIAATLLERPYLSTDGRHQGLILHSVYHRPNGWDYVRRGQRVPNGESSMWGDYHARELALLLLREARGQGPLRFFEVGCRLDRGRK